MRALKPYLLALAVSIALSACNSSTDYVESKKFNTQYVNPFIGTGAHGHTYPGAQSPFGMVQLSPDNGQSGWDWVSGYHYSDSVITGFSHTHLSGTGIGDLLDISIMPTIADFDLCNTYKNRLDKEYADFYYHNFEISEPGYYQVKLEKSKIIAELTALDRSGFHRYIFPANKSQKILIDLGFAQNWDSPYMCKIEIADSNTVVGYRHSKGWAKDQKLFFALKFSKKIVDFEICNDNISSKDKNQKGTSLKALLVFDNQSPEIEIKSAISAVDELGAIKNLMSELAELNFEQSVELSKHKWKNQLSKINVQSDSADLKTIFYTSLYHASMAPTLYSDVDGRYRGADSNIRRLEQGNQYTGLSLWDVFRTQNSMLCITNPKLANDIGKSMLRHFDQTGTLPVWILAGNETNTMTAYHSIPMLAELIEKEIADFDHEKAYLAMKATLMQDQRGLKQMRDYMYVPFDLLDESVTISLELGYNYYAVAAIAKKLKHYLDYDYFLLRSLAYKNLFDPEVQFMRGKDSKGEWRQNFDPKFSSHRVGTDYTEGNAWQHSWFVLHDVHGLIESFGSQVQFEQKLDQLFAESSEINGSDVSPDISGLIGQYAHGNEPSHHIAYMYHFIGKPWKSQQMVHRILREQYSNTPEGISGNEDMGQMSAWYVMSSLGLYPFNPVDGNFLIIAPLFQSCEINLEDGKSFKITTQGFSKKNNYIQSALLNGSELNKSYINYRDIIKGGELKLILGPEPSSTWGNNSESIPPNNH